MKTKYMAYIFLIISSLYGGYFLSIEYYSCEGNTENECILKYLKKNGMNSKDIRFYENASDGKTYAVYLDMLFEKDSTFIQAKEESHYYGIPKFLLK